MNFKKSLIESVKDLQKYSNKDIISLSSKLNIPFVTKKQAINAISFQLLHPYFHHTGTMDNLSPTCDSPLYDSIMSRTNEIMNMNNDCIEDSDPITGETWSDIPTNRYIRKGGGLNKCYDVYSICEWFNVLIKDKKWPNDPTTRTKIEPFKIIEIYRKMESSGHNLESLQKYSDFVSFLQSNENLNKTIEELEQFLKVDNNPIVQTEEEQELNLLYSSRTGNLSRLRELIESGTNINATDYNGYTALIYAVINNHFDIVEYLVSSNIDINAKNNDGLTATYFAVGLNRLNILRYLLDNNNNLTDDIIYDSVLFAIYNGHLDIVKYLVQDKNVNVNLVNEEGETILMYAVENNQINIIKYLVEEHNIDTSIMNNNGYTALMIAVNLGFNDIATYLNMSQK